MIKQIFPGLFLRQEQPMTQVVYITVEKAVLLEKVEHHQAVQYQIGVSEAGCFIRESLDRCKEAGMLCFISAIKASGKVFRIKHGVSA